MSSGEQRATIFASEAASYDAHRPSSPSAVIDMVVADHPALVVDAGCGTGKAARLVAQRNIAVLGVEPDERMAEVARMRSNALQATALTGSWSRACRTP